MTALDGVSGSDAWSVALKKTPSVASTDARACVLGPDVSKHVSMHGKPVFSLLNPSPCSWRAAYGATRKVSCGLDPAAWDRAREGWVSERRQRIRGGWVGLGWVGSGVGGWGSRPSEDPVGPLESMLTKSGTS